VPASENSSITSCGVITPCGVSATYDLRIGGESRLKIRPQPPAPAFLQSARASTGILVAPGNNHVTTAKELEEPGTRPIPARITRKIAALGDGLKFPTR